MSAPGFDPATCPLIIGGMHRSGTSLTASILASAGLDLGPELLAADANNAEGFFEDVRFLEFHIRALRAHGVGTEGFTTLDCSAVPELLEPVARQLVADRGRDVKPWGWKDPRTTLFLDFWQRLLPGARHVFIVRRPWEVVDSLLRRGDETFGLNPTLAVRVWRHYNSLIADFVQRHRDRCIVFDIAQVIADPADLVAAIRSRLGVPLSEPSFPFRPELFGRDDSGHRMEIVRAVSSDALDLYRELQRLAEGGGGQRDVPTAPSPAAMADLALVEWARASRAETNVRRLVTDLAAARAEFEAAVAAGRADTDAARAELEAARVQLAEVGANRDAVAAELAAAHAALARAATERLRLEADLTESVEEIRVLAEAIAEARRPVLSFRRLAEAVKRMLRRPPTEPEHPVLLRAFPDESATPRATGTTKVA